MRVLVIILLLAFLCPLATAQKWVGKYDVTKAAAVDDGEPVYEADMVDFSAENVTVGLYPKVVTLSYNGKEVSYRIKEVEYTSGITNESDSGNRLVWGYAISTTQPTGRGRAAFMILKVLRAEDNSTAYMICCWDKPTESPGKFVQFIAERRTTY